MKSRENAYFTVEAAMVMPIVVFVIALLIYLGLFQYDRCLREQDMGMQTLRSTENQWSAEVIFENQWVNTVDCIRMYRKATGGI